MRIFFILLLFFCFESIASSKNNDSLTLQLKNMKAKSQAKGSEDKKKIMNEATESLRKEFFENKMLKVGDLFPDFILKNAHGKTIELKEVRKIGPIIIAFYRGSWCPYCNAQLESYQKHLAEFKSKGANLIAISPEQPELSLILEKDKKLEFEVLTDVNNKFAQKLGLVFALSPELKKLYQGFGIDLEKSQANPDWKLPIPATYIISKEGKIIYTFFDVDYTLRADPLDLLKALEK